jgi:hypothetical protein
VRPEVLTAANINMAISLDAVCCIKAVKTAILKLATVSAVQCSDVMKKIIHIVLIVNIIT